MSDKPFWSDAAVSDGKSPIIWNSVELPTLLGKPKINNVRLGDPDVAAIWTSDTTPAISVAFCVREGDLAHLEAMGTSPVQEVAEGGASGGPIVNKEP